VCLGARPPTLVHGCRRPSAWRQERHSLFARRRQERRESFVGLALDEQRAQSARVLLTVGSIGQRSEPP
jgi:hypothetical protein